ncbi:protein FAM13B isoform X2 [Denticeps clupeoides]|uniref:Rho-GAP domain-containing protein n=1 Tax=Denticeps clupeoides TaxID=299321 RepID=A0AAY4E7B3_9TELE|nr:protein FAM13B isoform X2 [Denticeps clupeoides]
MRKSLSPSPGDSLSTARVFGIPLERVQQSGQPGHEVPLLVKHIVDYIEEHGGLDMEGLFQVNGNAERVEWLRQRYDNGEEVDLEKEADLASAVCLLRLFLQELPQPVIPPSLQTHVLRLYQEDNSEEELSRNMKYYLQQMPPVNYNLLRFLCRFLANVATLQEESWSTGALAAVFGPDIFHLDTYVEDQKEQESIGRILAELLDNQEEIFDSEEDDISTTNDYSSINEQITELLDDERLVAFEELPQDGEDQSSSHSPHVTASSSSHISPISILPGSADIIQRTIRAAVEHHFFELKSSIDQGMSSYESTGCQNILGNGSTEMGGTADDEEDLGQADEDQGVSYLEKEQSSNENLEKDCSSTVGHLEESSGMDLDTEAVVDSENNITIARQENYKSCEKMVQEEDILCDLKDLITKADPMDAPDQSNSSPQLQLSSIFPEGEWEACPAHFPLIDFSCMHLQKEGNDPVPACKVWQEESESGEAQLSPLAGRMVPLPLEDGTLPHARRFLDFGHSQRFLQQDPDSTSASKALAAGRPRRASFSSRESVKGDSVTQQLSKKLQSLKKKIRQFEEQFEKEKKYKPSHGDKVANPKVLKWMTDLTKIRKQIKDAKHRADGELAPQLRPRSNTLPKSFGSTLEHSASEGPERRPTHQETLEFIQQRIRRKREEDGWPEDVRKMTKEQLDSEKMMLQKYLLHYEGLHGRPVTREERLRVKPLYDRYRLVKQMVTRVSITPIIASPSSKRRNQTLQPIIEGETAHFCDEIKEEEEDLEEQKADEVSPALEVILSLGSDAQTSSQKPPQPKTEEGPGKMGLGLDLRLSSSSMPELLEQLWKARAEKKKLGKTIREFEDEFYQQNGRNVQKEDKLPMMDEYKEYKRIKAKLRLLEVLISKQDSSKSI